MKGKIIKRSKKAPTWLNNDQCALFDRNGLIFYDIYIVAFSGGKDSIACVLHLLDIGVPKYKIELWHHNIDGEGETFMDWEVTPAYCKAFADAFGLKIYYSWKLGGFKREMLRDNQLTAPTAFQCPDGSITIVGGKRGKKSSRLKFPQVTADLSQRWCSAYLKIDVCSCAVSNQKRFNGLKTVIISGERGEESAARSKYADLEKDKSDNRFIGTRTIIVKRKIKGVTREIQTKVTVGKANRFVDRWRPVKDWTEQEIWSIIEKYKVRVHPCYYMGFGRCSCKFCIFGNANQFASSYSISPLLAEEVMSYEDSFGVTIKRKMSLRELISLGNPYPSITKKLAQLATSHVYDLQILFNSEESWILPAGAFGENCGPI